LFHEIIELLVNGLKVIIRHKAYLPLFLAFVIISSIISVTMSVMNYIDYESRVFVGKIAVRDNIISRYCSTIQYCRNTTYYSREELILCLLNVEILLNKSSFKVPAVFVDIDDYNNASIKLPGLPGKISSNYLSVGYDIARNLNISKNMYLRFVNLRGIYKVGGFHKTSTLLDEMLIVFTKDSPTLCNYYVVLVKTNGELPNNTRYPSKYAAMVLGLNKEMYNIVSSLLTQFLILYPLLTLVLTYKILVELREHVRILVLFGNHRYIVLILPLAIVVISLIAMLFGVSLSTILLDVGIWISRFLNIYFPFRPFLNLTDLITIILLPLPLIYVSSIIVIVLLGSRLWG